MPLQTLFLRPTGTINTCYFLIIFSLDAFRFAYFSRASLDYLVKLQNCPDILHIRLGDSIVGPLFWDIFVNQVKHEESYFLWVCLLIKLLVNVICDHLLSHSFLLELVAWLGNLVNCLKLHWRELLFSFLQEFFLPSGVGGFVMYLCCRFLF